MKKIHNQKEIEKLKVKKFCSLEFKNKSPNPEEIFLDDKKKSNSNVISKELSTNISINDNTFQNYFNYEGKIS